MHTNRLANETSPYLLQHADNPVHWMPWGEEAAARAREENRLIFLSIGYSTCHWCHVMARESFENPETARLLNEHFVSVKVDREERPEVDALYMAFVQASTGAGGWPMSVWLTPELKPVVGGTYFPPHDGHGRPGFPTVLRHLAEAWHKNAQRLREQGDRVMAALAEGAQGVESGGTFPGVERAAAAALHFSRAFDPVEAGFGDAPKFPRPAVLHFLLRESAATGRDEPRAMVLQTLTAMARGGMHDHLGGGFHRYSVDAAWRVPHFEKMLYDQAQLACAYLEAWQGTGVEEHAAVVRSTLDAVLGDLRLPGGAFASAEDADSVVAGDETRHAEGAFYVWTRQEILDVLGPEQGAAFCQDHGVLERGNVPAGADPHGELTGKNVLRLIPGAQASAWVEARRRLGEVRARRPRPHRDDKVLTAWNGLTISALARAGAVLGEERYLAAAKGAAEFLQDHLVAGDGGLRRCWCEGRLSPHGYADDHAFLIQGLLDLYEARGDIRWLQWADHLQSEMDRHFLDGRDGLYFTAAAGDPLVPVRLKPDHDGAEPSANSVAALNLLRLGAMLDDPGRIDAGRRILSSSAPALERFAAALPQMLVAWRFSLRPPAQAVLTGDSGEASPLARALHRPYHPDKVVLWLDRDEGRAWLQARVPRLAAFPPAGPAQLHWCEDFVCRAPVQDEAGVALVMAGGKVS